jgi:hypothetical protein
LGFQLPVFSSAYSLQLFLPFLFLISPVYLCHPFLKTMTTKTVSRSFRPLLVIFFITNVLFVTNRARFSNWDLDVDVLIIGNLVLFAASAISFYLFTRSLNSKNPQAVVRTVYSGVVSKMMICLVAVFIYISIAGKGVNKGGIFGCMFLYLLYTTLEVAILMKLSKQKKNV